MQTSPRKTQAQLVALRSCLSVAVALSVTAIAGCNRGPEMYHVKGKVLYKDGTVPTAGVCVVGFRPSDNSTAAIRKGASGGIAKEDGSFEMFTRTPGDGVHRGEYDVTFTIIKSPTDPTSMIPTKYSIPGESGYTVQVEDDIDDLKFEIEPLPGAPRATASGSAAPPQGGAG